MLEHQGVVPAFTSQIFLAPDDRLGLMAFTNGTHNGLFWLPTETATLFHSLLGAPEETIRTDVPHHPEIWADLCGSYHLAGPLTDVRVRGMAGAGFQVFVRRGQLFLRFLSLVPALLKGFPLHPDDPRDPYAFRIELPASDLTLRVVFSQQAGRTTALHLDVMPISARKQPAITGPTHRVADVPAVSRHAISGSAR